MRKISKNLKDPRIVLFAAPVILLAPIFLTGKAFFWGTPGTQFVPWWDFVWRSVLAGESPFWNPLVGLGSPLAANYQSALFYPPTWIYFFSYLLGGIKFMAWMITILVGGHLIWAGWGTARLLKDLGVDEAGQAVAGLAYALSGYLVARAGFLSINAAAAWIPWLMMMVFRLAKSRSGSFFKLVAALAMLLLAGHAQTAVYGILIAGIWGVYWGLVSATPGERFVNLGKTIGGYLAAGLWAAGIAAVQLLPTAQYLMNSQRAAEYGYEQAMTYSFWPWRFLTMIMPDLFGNPAQGNYWGYGNFWEDATYIGLLPLLLGFGFLIKSLREKKHQGIGDGAPGLGWFLTGIALVGFGLALGKNTAVFPFLYQHLPGADLFQAPTRLSILAVISLAILAGLGTHFITKPVGRRLYFTRLAVAGSAAIILGAVLTGTVTEDLNSTFFSAAAWAGGMGLLAAVLLLLRPDDDQLDKLEWWNWALVLLISLDLIRAGWGLNPGIAVDFYQVERREETEGRIWMPAEIEYDLKFNRFLRFDSFQPELDWESMHEVLLPNLGMLQNIEMVNNFDPLVPGTYQAWMDAINHEMPNPGILEMMGVSGIIQTSEIGLPGIAAISEERSPAVHLAGCADVLEPDQVSPEMILNSDEDLQENLLVLSEQEVECVPGSSGRLTEIVQRNGFLSMQVDLEQSGWIFWSQTWYPGWIYKIDGVKAGPTYRANYLFQAVPVPKDAQKVELVYKPLSLIWGSVISAASVLSMAAVSRRRSKS